MFGFKKVAMPKPTEALPGRAQPIRTATAHFINHRALKGPYPEGTEKAMFGLGCFWGAERKFWELGEGIHVTAVGYAGGMTPNPTYEEVCSGRTGHNEVVFVVYDPQKITYEQLLKTFWENHDPTQGMRQGNDIGTQYRSGIYTFTPTQKKAAEASKAMYEQELKKKRYGAITTEIVDAGVLFCRGLSPAVSCQESLWLLRAGRNRGRLSDRDRSKADARRDGLIALHGCDPWPADTRRCRSAIRCGDTILVRERWF